MAVRQSATPVQFGRTRRHDDSVIMSSGNAGKVVPVTYIPLLRGDSASGRVGVDIDLAEMPRPLRNAVIANVQAWFVPKPAFPQFAGYDDFIASYHGKAIKTLEASDREPPRFFGLANENRQIKYAASDFAKTLGLHIGLHSAGGVNVDLVDAYALIHNFRLAAHSSKLTRVPYFRENVDAALKLKPAFWPSGRFSSVVPDYERALVVGNLDLDVMAGQIPLGISRFGGNTGHAAAGVELTSDSAIVATGSGAGRRGLTFDVSQAQAEMFAELSGQTIGITLANIDKARETQAFAKLRSAYAGNDTTGFNNDDAILADLMQGFRVPEEEFNRPWLLDSKRVVFGMQERHATNSDALDVSVTQGRASATLNLNVPANEGGGVIMVVLEVLPERLDERQSDEWLYVRSPDDLPDALRDVQRPEPVDYVRNRRIDARHNQPNGLYGYEPMNDVWNRATTRLGGVYYQADPSNPWTEQRSAIWQVPRVNPVFDSSHWLAPDNFPNYVFSDTLAPAFEFVARHTVSIVGLTQIGDVLVENNDDYQWVSEQQED